MALKNILQNSTLITGTAGVTGIEVVDQIPPIDGNGTSEIIKLGLQVIIAIITLFRFKKAKKEIASEADPTKCKGCK